MKISIKEITAVSLIFLSSVFGLWMIDKQGWTIAAIFTGWAVATAGIAIILSVYSISLKQEQDQSEDQNTDFPPVTWEEYDGFQTAQLEDDNREFGDQ